MENKIPCISFLDQALGKFNFFIFFFSQAISAFLDPNPDPDYTNPGSESLEPRYSLMGTDNQGCGSESTKDFQKVTYTSLKKHEILSVFSL